MRPNNTSPYPVHQASLPDASNTVTSDDGGSVRPVTTAVISGAGERMDSGDGQSLSERSAQQVTVAGTFGLESSQHGNTESLPTGTRLAHLSAHIERLLVDQWADDKITEYRNQMQQINAGLKDLEQLELKPSEQYRKVKKQFEELQVKDFHHSLNKLQDKLEGGNTGSSKDIQSIEQVVTQLSKHFDELALVGDEERSRLLEHQEALSNQLGEVKRYFSIHNEIKSLEADLKDFKLRELPGPDQIINFFDNIEGSLSEIITLIDSLPKRSQRTKLLEKKCQLRDSLNTSKKAVKQQKLESIEQIIESQKSNVDKGGALNKAMLKKAEDQLDDLKRLMNSLKMDEQEIEKLKKLKGRLEKLNLTYVDDQVSGSKTKSSDTGLLGIIIDNLDKAEAIIRVILSDPFGFNEQWESEANGYLDKARDGLEKLHDIHQRDELLFRLRSLSLLLRETIKEKKGKFVQEEVEHLFGKADTIISLFSSPVKVEEIKKVDALLEQAREQMCELSGDEYFSLLHDLISKYSQLKEKLQIYKDNISDSQQASAAAKGDTSIVLNSRKQLHQAVKNGDIETLKCLLQTTSDIPVNAKENGLTPLCRAASEGYSGCVKVLLKVHGILVNKKSDFGCTPLWTAACYGYPECVEALLKVPGILVNEESNDGLTPLCVAARFGNMKCLSLFLANNEVKITLLCEVCNGKTKVLEELLDTLYNLTEPLKSEALTLVLNVADRDGKTLLCRAAQYRHERIVALFLNALNGLAKERKSEATMTVLSAADSFGRTPLYIAAESGQQKVVEQLLNTLDGMTESERANAIQKVVHAGDAYGVTPLHRAACRGHHKVVGQLLDTVGRLPATAMRKAFTAVVNAADQKVVEQFLSTANNYQESEQQIVACEAMISAFVTFKRTSLAVAVDNVVELTQAFPLLSAVLAGHNQSVKQLMQALTALPREKRGSAILATLNKPRKEDGATPLYIAAREGNIEIMKLLLDAVTTLLADGKRKEAREVLYSACTVKEEDVEITPLRIAAINRHDKAVNLLLEKIRELFIT